MVGAGAEGGYGWLGILESGDVRRWNKVGGWSSTLRTWMGALGVERLGVLELDCREVVPVMGKGDFQF